MSTYTGAAGRTYGVMLDDHAVQQGADGVETTHVQTCEVGKSVKQWVYTTSLESTELSSFSQSWWPQSEEFPKQRAVPKEGFL